jgi:hypothetical protein
MNYKLYKTSFDQQQPNAAMTVGIEPCKSFIFDPANTDYANFKKEILADEAQLEDVDGNVMPPEVAKAYVKELP